MSVEVTAAGRLADGRAVSAVELSSPAMTVRLLDLGATLWQLAPHPGPERSICLFHGDATDYAENPPYLGCTVGPVANRISGSKFRLDGKRYKLVPNEGSNHLHGGPTGFGRRLWEFDTDRASNSVTFRIRRPDGEGGYPGNLDVEVTWTLEDDQLRFEWSASSDAPTPVSIANHAYWNLAGGGTIEDHHLLVDSASIVEIDGQLLPTGALAPVDGTPFDLRGGRRIGDALHELGDGIDHCYSLDPGAEVKLVGPRGELSLGIRTSLPGIQVYTGHMLDGSPRQGRYGPLAGLCLETQFFPDAVNQPAFLSPVSAAGEPVSHWTIYKLHRDRNGGGVDASSK